MMAVIKNCQCLNSEERGELARKFKYYHKTVKPHDRFNLVETINGTYFSLNSELEMLQSRVYEEASAQLNLVKYSTEEWPNLAIKFTFSSQWQYAIVSVYLPSLLIFSVALCAQWKRRKVQVLVSVTSIISIIVIQTSHQKPYMTSISMQDVWLSGLLIHLICILTIDLLLPSRRIIFTNPTSNTI
uniref:Uncharacterized protein n=1 Tax=Ditylenchus dipsaci TaxID=166011 RepID=A0A915ET26_9BILA